MKRVLVAGVGNVLRGDDGLGVRALERLRASAVAAHPSVRLWESGIAGVGLVQELMDGYQALVIIDALERGAPPGKVFVLEPDRPDTEAVGRPGATVDLHEAKPEGVLRLAAAAGALPEKVWIVGAQVASVDELTEWLSPEVERALPEVVDRVEGILGEILGRDVRLADEILQVLFWLRGEGLSEDVAPADLTRWLSLDEPEIAAVLLRMHGLGLVARGAAGRFRLTEEGRREGGRRFQDEFSEMTLPGHGECGDPDCECRESGDPADCRHVAG